MIDIAQDDAPARPKWLVRDLVIGLAVLAGVRCLGLVLPAKPGNALERISHWWYLVPLLLFQLFLLCYPLILARRRGQWRFAWPGARALAIEAGWAALVTMGILTLLGSLNAIVRLFSPDASFTPDIWQRAPLTPEPGMLFTILATSFTLGPICEEVFFRGFLYNAMRMRMAVGIALVAQAMVFGLVHGYRVLPSIALALLGVVLALVYEWRKTLLAPIFVHAGHNFLAALILVALFVANANAPVLGVDGQDRPQGCLVTHVWPDSGADKAGIVAGDVITDVNREQVKGFEHLRTTMRKYRPGGEVSVGILRDGVRENRAVELQSRRAMKAQSASGK